MLPSGHPRRKQASSHHAAIHGGLGA